MEALLKRMKKGPRRNATAPTKTPYRSKEDVCTLYSMNAGSASHE
jgi:hypothetical protein